MCISCFRCLPRYKKPIGAEEKAVAKNLGKHEKC
jgi:hypothetical protein